MTGVGLFLMLSSFLYYLVRSRGNYSGRSQGPCVRVTITFVVMLSWLGGMGLLLVFAPITDKAIALSQKIHSYLLAFSCLFILVVFVTLKGAYENSKAQAIEDKLIDQSISTALQRFSKPSGGASAVRQSYSRASGDPRAGSTRAGARAAGLSVARPSQGVVLTETELQVIATDAHVRAGSGLSTKITVHVCFTHCYTCAAPILSQEMRKHELTSAGSMCIALTASALLVFAPIIVFFTAIVTTVLRVAYNLCCCCLRPPRNSGASMRQGGLAMTVPHPGTASGVGARPSSNGVRQPLL